MRRGVCVKCGAADVRAARNGLTGGEVSTAVRPHLNPDFRGMSRNHQGEVWQYVCTTCGYLEWHVHDPGTLAFMRANWVPVPPS